VNIAVDIDGTVAYSQPLMVEVLNKLTGKSVSVDDVTKFDLSYVYDVSDEFIKNVFKDYGEYIFGFAKKFKDSPDVLNRFYQAGHNVYFITARDHKYTNLTRLWLNKNGFEYNKLIIVPSFKDKLLKFKQLNIDVAIEDHPDLIMEFCTNGIPTIAMVHPYTGDIEHRLLMRAGNWDHVFMYLISFLAERGERTALTSIDSLNESKIKK